MLYSMTGYGKAVVKLPNRDVSIEIKSLNSKQLDLSVRMPSVYSPIDGRIRSEIAKLVERGKVELSIRVDNIASENGACINVPIVKKYKEQIIDAANEIGAKIPENWFEILLRMPEAITTEVKEVNEDESEAIVNGVIEAINALSIFREQEGAMLQSIFEAKIANIRALLESVEPYEKERIEKIKNRLIENLEKIKEVDYDKNRFEQELIFYIEKLDINEEKTRLDNHLNYFLETMAAKQGQGKKLGFIAQEMGREINTMGSKANNAELQRIVVQMKDELEQIKEQVLNVL
ncbi:MAG: YicC family protein [Bacteroidales bacterium]|nr:YicC family protein [Bacteroidales bacterium]MBQ7819144.1 YicC family protein [Bacteroidales bacterium]